MAFYGYLERMGPERLASYMILILQEQKKTKLPRLKKVHQDLKNQRKRYWRQGSLKEKIAVLMGLCQKEPMKYKGYYQKEKDQQHRMKEY